MIQAIGAHGYGDRGSGSVSRLASASTRCMRVASGSERLGKPLAWMSRWRRFLTTLASGITWNQMLGRHRGIDDAVRANSQLTVGKPDVAPPVVPGSEPSGGGSSASRRAAARSGKRLGSLQSITSWNRAGMCSIWRRIQNWLICAADRRPGPRIQG